MEWQMEEHPLFGCVLLFFGNEALLVIRAGEVDACVVNCFLEERQ
jgi:hypothetical protein